MSPPIATMLAGLEHPIVLLAFLDPWSPADTPAEVLAEIRAELRGLGAALFIVASDGLFVLEPDDPLRRLAHAHDLDEIDIARFRRAYGLRGCPNRGYESGLFVRGPSGDVRFAHVWTPPEQPDVEALRDALRDAGRSLLTVPLAGLVSRREAVLGLVVASLAVAFGAGCRDHKPGTNGPPPTTTTTGQGGATVGSIRSRSRRRVWLPNARGLSRRCSSRPIPMLRSARASR